MLILGLQREPCANQPLPSIWGAYNLQSPFTADLRVSGHRQDCCHRILMPTQAVHLHLGADVPHTAGCRYGGCLKTPSCQSTHMLAPPVLMRAATSASTVKN